MKIMDSTAFTSEELELILKHRLSQVDASAVARFENDIDKVMLEIQQLSVQHNDLMLQLNVLKKGLKAIRPDHIYAKDDGSTTASTYKPYKFLFTQSEFDTWWKANKNSVYRTTRYETIFRKLSYPTIKHIIEKYAYLKGGGDINKERTYEKYINEEFNRIPNRIETNYFSFSLKILKDANIISFDPQ